MPVPQKPRVQPRPASLPDPYKKSIPAIRTGFASDWDALKSKARSVGFPVKFKNITGSSVGLGEVLNEAKLERLEQRVRDALAKHNGGLQVLKA